METNPAIPAPSPTNHPVQTKLAALLAALSQRQALLRQPLFDRGKHMRSGVTKNKGRGQSKRRRVMARESRRRNRR